MSLRRQLLLVSLLTLVLPWAGCQFIRETETALRNGQQQMLAGTSIAIADSLSQFPQEFRRGGDGSFSPDQVYGHPLSGAPLIDGYFDDWPLDEASQRQLAGSDGAVRFVFGVHRQYVYLFVDVRDAEIRYRRNDGDDSVDQVIVLTSDEQSPTSRILFATEAPGDVVALRQTGEAIAQDSRIAAYWQDTANGYRLEARIPRSLAGSHIGVEVHDADESGLVVGRSFSGAVPGRFITTSPLLASVADGYTQAGMRLTITDASGWRLADAGDLAGSGDERAALARRAPALPAGWQRLLYRTLLEAGDAAVLAEPDPSGRESQDYVARALNGEASTRWFRNRETGRAVVAVAQPVWSGNVQTGALLLQHDTDAILSLTNESLLRLITLTLVATLGAGLVLLGYASWLSMRIRRLSHAADHALDAGAAQVELPSANAADEIGDLSRSFSSVLSELAGYNDYLRSLASKLSHELRTPLTIVTSSLENLEQEALPPRAREYTERAGSGAKRLRRILNAMSEASRVEQLMENADVRSFDLRRVVEPTVAAYRDAWPERRFAFTAGADGYPVSGSPELLVQLLDKLVDNAVDFSQGGDEITVAIRREDGEVLLSVTNPGPPLPDTLRHRIFQSMVSVRAQGGEDNLGLGLHIARIIAEGHGGSLTATNTPDGVRFELRLDVG